MTRRLITASLISLCAFLFSAAASFAAPVPDTGQTQSYTNTFGEDSDYSCNPHSYTVIGNGVVKDNVTGLEWQQATAPGTYTLQQAIDYCNNLSFGGKDDWRLPTIKELSTLVDSSIPYPGPTINTSYFPDTVAARYWSYAIDADGIDHPWYVNFSYGNVSTFVVSSYYYVRAVRGGQSNNGFVDNSDGTVTDTATGLMWQQATAPGTYTWEQALTYCESLTLPAGGYSDWRLPNRNELQSIVDYSRYNPAIDTTYFSGTVASNYWSSTTLANGTSDAWFVVFYNGSVGYGGKAGGYSVRAVRGGQCESGPFGYLGISKSGYGTGIVTSTDGKIECGNDCKERYGIATQVTLHAAADAGSVFTGWSGEGCSGTGECTMIMDAPKFVTAIFKIANDRDDDGVTDSVDNCPNTFNPQQEDVDEDGIGNACDNCLNVSNPDQADSDNNGIGDRCDTDYLWTALQSCQNPPATTTTVPPTNIELSILDAIPANEQVILQWKTETETGNAGFNVWRADNFVKINDGLIPALGSAVSGSEYDFVDQWVLNGKRYFYLLEDIDNSGISTFHGSVKATPRLIFGIGK